MWGPHHAVHHDLRQGVRQQLIDFAVEKRVSSHVQTDLINFYIADAGVREQQVGLRNLVDLKTSSILGIIATNFKFIQKVHFEFVQAVRLEFVQAVRLEVVHAVHIEFVQAVRCPGTEV